MESYLDDDKKWHIVQFVEDDTIEAVPDFWIQKDGNCTKWPPWNKHGKFDKALGTRQVPDSTWKLCALKKVHWDAVYDNYKDARVKAKIGESHSDIEVYYRMLFDSSSRKDRSKKEASSTEDELNCKTSCNPTCPSPISPTMLPQVLLGSKTVLVDESEYVHSNLIKSVVIVHPPSSNKESEGTGISDENKKQIEFTDTNTNYSSSPSNSLYLDSEPNDQDDGTIDNISKSDSSTTTTIDSGTTAKEKEIKEDKITTKCSSTVTTAHKQTVKQKGSQCQKSVTKNENFPTTSKTRAERSPKNKWSVDLEDLKQLDDSEKLDYLIVSVHHLNENLAKLQMQIKNANLQNTSSVVMSNDNFSSVMDMQSYFKLKTVEQMNLLDSKINEDKEFKNNLLKYLETIGGSSNDIVRSMLRTCITNELATHYSYQGKKGKHSFSDTKLHKLIRDTAIKIAQYDRNKVKTEAQTWLKNAPQRLQKEKDETNKNEKKRKSNDKADGRPKKHKLEPSSSSD